MNLKYIHTKFMLYHQQATWFIEFLESGTTKKTNELSMWFRLLMKPRNGIFV